MSYSNWILFLPWICLTRQSSPWCKKGERKFPKQGEPQFQVRVCYCRLSYHITCWKHTSDFVALNGLATCKICNLLWKYVWARQKRMLMIRLFLNHMMSTLMAAKPKSLSHFSPLPLFHSLTPLAPHSSAGVKEWEWGSGVKEGGGKNNGTHPIKKWAKKTQAETILTGDNTMVATEGYKRRNTGDLRKY